MASKPQVIALEEHYIDPEVKPHIGGRDRTGFPDKTLQLDGRRPGRVAESGQQLGSLHEGRSESRRKG